MTTIDPAWYKSELNVSASCKTAPARSESGSFSEEYIRARFVYALISSGKFNPECLCVEAQLPKGSGGKSINPDILAFKDETWAGKDFSSSEVRQGILCVFEAKRNDKNDTKSVIEKQLRTAMNEYEGDPANEINFVFGVYFDDQPNVLVFKKENNHPIKRFSSDKIRKDDPWNIGNRDDVDYLPGHCDLIARVDSLKNKANLAYKPKSGSNIVDQDYQVFPFEVNNCGYEVKTKKRLVVFEPRFLIDEKTFTEALDVDGNKLLLEDFSELQNRFAAWVKFQEPELREAFNV